MKHGISPLTIFKTKILEVGEINWGVMLLRRPISRPKFQFVCQRGEFIEMIINFLRIFPAQFFSIHKSGQFRHIMG